MSNWHIKELFSPVRYETVDVDDSIQSILFENETYLGVPPSPEGQSLPGMVCVHGDGGPAFRQ